MAVRYVYRPTTRRYIRPFNESLAGLSGSHYVSAGRLLIPHIPQIQCNDSSFKIYTCGNSCNEAIEAWPLTHSGPGAPFMGHQGKSVPRACVSHAKYLSPAIYRSGKGSCKQPRSGLVHCRNKARLCRYTSQHWQLSRKQEIERELVN